MRTITEKDKRGLLISIRVFLRHFLGERLSESAGKPLIEKLLRYGIPMDKILNYGNWMRAKEKKPDMTFEDFINFLCEGGDGVQELRKEENWYEQEKGFQTVAEAAHDFFLEVSGRGGKWNIPSALTNLAKAIEKYSLQAILSEKLIGEVTDKNPETNYFNYLTAIVEDFKSLSIDTSPTENELYPETEDNDIENSQKETDETERPEDAPFPEDEIYQEEEETATGTETIARILYPNPNETKKKELKNVLVNYTFSEISGLVKTIPNGEKMTIDEIHDNLVRGKFDVSAEDEKTREIHRSINADLQPCFISCVNQQGVAMDEVSAAEHDILHESWDYSTPKSKRLLKLLRLIYDYGKDDPDLLDAVADIEELYSEN